MQRSREKKAIRKARRLARKADRRKNFLRLLRTAILVGVIVAVLAAAVYLLQTMGVLAIFSKKNCHLADRSSNRR